VSGRLGRQYASVYRRVLRFALPGGHEAPTGRVREAAPSGAQQQQQPQPLAA
jgi:hypothetical protein